jgi:hypothetical protein
MTRNRRSRSPGQPVGLADLAHAADTGLRELGLGREAFVAGMA